MALVEKNLSYKTRFINLWSYDQMKPEFLRLNPKGQVPILVHDGKVIVESDEIVDYLDKNFESGISLVPRDKATNAQMWNWIELQENYPRQSWRILAIGNKHPFPGNIIQSWLQKNYYGKIPFVQAQLQKHPPGSEFHEYYHNKLKELTALEETLFDEQKRQAIINKIEEALDKVEAQVAHTPWLLGNKFSLADIVWLSVIDRLADVQMNRLWEQQCRPAIGEYLSRLRDRPSYKLVFERPFKSAPLYILLSYFG